VGRETVNNQSINLSINNPNFHDYVHLIYPDELKIRDTTKSDKFASYLDILLTVITPTTEG
jgi:hypothetical protein